MEWIPNFYFDWTASKGSDLFALSEWHAISPTETAEWLLSIEAVVAAPNDLAEPLTSPPRQARYGGPIDSGENLIR